MSIIDQLPWRLYWTGRKGLAIGPSAMMSLSVAPYIGIDFAEIDYAPAVDVRLIRRTPSSPLDDMAADEIAACKRFLAALG